VVWAFWGSLAEIADRWRRDPQYSHGWLVPLFSLYLLYIRRNLIPSTGLVQRWWGLMIVALAMLARFTAVMFYQPWLDAGSLLLALLGCFATIGGRAGLRWSFPAVAFLAFMIPLPFRLQSALGGSLQAIATKSSTYLLQAIGVPAIAEGNVILLTNERIGVMEACNGLSMLMTFFALACGFALLVERHWLYAVSLILAAAPIAVAANVVRITVTALLIEGERNATAKVVFHDVAGWLMMPLGVGLLLALMWYLDRLTRPSLRPS